MPDLDATESANGGEMKPCKCGCGKLIAELDVRNRPRFYVLGHGAIGGPVKHRDEESPEYKAWGHMIERCVNPKCKSWKNYGARGIIVCHAWRNDYRTFLRDVGRRPTPKHSIERINNDGNYEPGNVRWATATEQALNTRKNHRVTIGGKTRSLTEWGRIFKIHPNTLRGRVRANLSANEITSRYNLHHKRTGQQIMEFDDRR